MTIFPKCVSFMLFCGLLTLAGCGSDESSVTTGGGSSGVSSDGGSASASFAGTYRGTITLAISGGSIDDSSSTEPATLVVRTDGTATLTIGDDESIEGVIDGDTFGFSVRVVEEDGLLECEADAVLTGRITGVLASGTVSGRGRCDILAASTGIDLSGTLSVSR